MNIGVLALQGDFYRHAAHLKQLDIMPIFVKQPQDLKDCHGLIIPGGESTTLVKLMKKGGLFDAIPKFNRERPIFGTCAGAILASRKVHNRPVDTLNLIDIEIERNAYGRQIDSFIDTIDIRLSDEKYTTEAVFIRAPIIRSCGKDVDILSVHKDDIVMAENKRVLVATFHPELTESTLIHRYFINKVKKL